MTVVRHRPDICGRWAWQRPGTVSADPEEHCLPEPPANPYGSARTNSANGSEMSVFNPVFR